MVNVATARPTRADYYKVLADNLPPQALVVTSLGNASYLWATVHDAPENFYFEDAMGLALPLALGLAVAQPKRPVIVVEGDGGLLMHMGALVTVGAVDPANLTVLVDPERRPCRVRRPGVDQCLARSRATRARRRHRVDRKHRQVRKRLPTNCAAEPHATAPNAWCWRPSPTSTSSGRRPASIPC